MAVACTPTVKVEVPKEPITIDLNVKIEHEILTIDLNVKIEHEILVKVEKELEDLFSKESGLF
ncbi:MAG: hypothetical protein AMJ84_12485 [Acidithiobacillales bacterium SM23_46]|nr:MAG: hypothetical protein AMJ84_12485 [Acidithiobacillales bacterium SM23_46]